MFTTENQLTVFPTVILIAILGNKKIELMLLVSIFFNMYKSCWIGRIQVLPVLLVHGSKQKLIFLLLSCINLHYDKANKYLPIRKHIIYLILHARGFYKRNCGIYENKHSVFSNRDDYRVAYHVRLGLWWSNGSCGIL